MTDSLNLDLSRVLVESIYHSIVATRMRKVCSAPISFLADGGRGSFCRASIALMILLAASRSSRLKSLATELLKEILKEPIFLESFFHFDKRELLIVASLSHGN